MISPTIFIYTHLRDKSPYPDRHRPPPPITNTSKIGSLGHNLFLDLNKN